MPSSSLLDALKQHPSLFASYQAALSVAALLNAQTQGAKGQRVVVSMSEALLEVQSLLFAQFQQDQRIPALGSNLFSGAFPCYRLYTLGCGRRIAVGCIEPKFWSRFCNALGAPQEKVEQWLEGQFAIGEKATSIVRSVEEFLKKQSWRDLGPILDQLDCCVEPVLHFGEVPSIYS